jgi:V8-like Glu-specific endopeptidase
MARSLRSAALGSVLGACFMLVACASDSTPDERIGRTAAAIVGSKPSDSSQDAVVMLVFSDPAKNRRGICTAALLAPRLVLTARHCVADTDADVACTADGSPANGGAVIGNHEAGQLYVFTGKDRPDLDPTTWKPAGRGMEVLDDGAKNLCNHDIALILLEQPITGVPLATIRLDGTADRGEQLTTIGWGVTSKVDEPTVRQQRTGVSVTRLGPDETSPALAPNELGFDESICLGDSGGPILSQDSGAVVGVVSRGGNGTSGPDFLSTCTKAVNLATKLAPFKDLVMRGFSRAGAEPRLEPPKATEPTSGCAVASRPAPRGTTGFGSSLLGAAGVVGLGVFLARVSRRQRHQRAEAQRLASGWPSTHESRHCSAGSPLRSETPPRCRSTASGFARTRRR